MVRRVLIVIVVILVGWGAWWGYKAATRDKNQAATQVAATQNTKPEAEAIVAPAPVQTGADNNGTPTPNEPGPVQSIPGKPAVQANNDSIVAAIEKGFQSASKEVNEKLDTLLGRTNKTDGKVDALHGKVDGIDKRLAALEACQPGCKPGATAAAAATARSTAKSTTNVVSQRPAARAKAPAQKAAPAATTPAAAVAVAEAKPAVAAADDHHRRASDWRTPWAPGVTDGNTFFAQAAVVQDQQIQYQTTADKGKSKSNCGNPCR